MKILLLWDYYVTYLQYFYTQNQEIVKYPYEQQLKAIQKDYFAWNSYLVPYLNEMGNDVCFIIGNAKHLQQTWARENDFRFDKKNWQFSIIHEQIRRYKPDVLWFSGTPHYYGDFLNEVSDFCGYVIAWKAAAWSNRLDWSRIDCVLSSQPNFVNQFRKMGKQSELVFPCFESSIVNSSESFTRDIECAFIGSLRMVSFRRRLEALTYLYKRVPLQIFSEKISWKRNPVPLRPFLTQLRFLPFYFQSSHHSAVYGMDMFRILQRSKIVFNIHVDAADGFAGNIRMFETTGSGSLLITERAPNLSQIFEPDKEVVTYSSLNEAVEKIKYYSIHDKERESIAKAGQKRTFTEHRPELRAREFIDKLPIWIKESRLNKRIIR